MPQLILLLREVDEEQVQDLVIELEAKGIEVRLPSPDESVPMLLREAVAPTDILTFIGESVAAAVIAEIVSATRSWARREWERRYRPKHLGSIQDLGADRITSIESEDGDD